MKEHKPKDLSDEKEKALSPVPSDEVVVSEDISRKSEDTLNVADEAPCLTPSLKSSTPKFNGNRKKEYRLCVKNERLYRILRYETFELECSMESYIATAVSYYIKHSRKNAYQEYKAKGLIE